MMGHREKLKSGAEYDAIYKVPLKVYDNNTGLRKYVKKQINRRERRKAREQLGDVRLDCLT